MDVPISFTLDVNAKVWAGADAGSMTTKQVTDEVQRHVEKLVRDIYEHNDWLLPDDDAPPF